MTFKTIPVSEQIHKKIWGVKIDLGKKTLNEALAHLINLYDKKNIEENEEKERKKNKEEEPKKETTDIFNS